MERVHRMELQYDGTGLHGWAKQEGLATVEGALEHALQTVLGVTPDLSVAGRTDAGVHARRQVVSLTLPPETDVGRLTRSLNALTPPGVAIRGIWRARPGFDARKDATGRIYRYYLCTLPVVPPFWTRYCWHVPYPLDETAAKDCAAATVGRHDFTAFTPTETEHVFFDRTVAHCAWRNERGGLAGVHATGPRDHPGGMRYLEIEANAFLRHMVRTLVGTIVETALGKRSVADFAELLHGSPRLVAGPTAPPQGLFFWDVRYA